MIINKSRFGFTLEQNNSDARLRVRILMGVATLIFAVVLSRLIYLTIFEGDRQLLFAENNHIELLRENAPRGLILDRQGEPLVKNIDGTREYPYGVAGASITGYISEVKEDELGCRDGICYSQGELVGRAGVEQLYEATLKGRDGGRIVELDSVGRQVREIGQTKSEAGDDVQLTIDASLQKIMYESLSGRAGSAVMIDLSGHILGMVSSPSFDPNLFTVKKDPKELTQMLSDKEHFYFLNRAVSGTYPPGSVFKLVTAIAGLSSGAINFDTVIEDTGEIKIGKYRYGNWYFDQYGRKEGSIDVAKALARSNDIFFYKTGEMMGIDTLVSWAKKFGLGEKTGLELPASSAGLLPDPLWKERQTGEKWFLGNTYHLAIGQGDLLVTPLQIARMTVAVISGRLCDTHLIERSEIKCQDLGVETAVLVKVQEGMKGVCQTGGTAFPLFDFQPYLLCKTGTAQHSGQSDENKVLPHAWITVAYPGENPTVILTVMLESAGEGSAEAAPIAKTILMAWKEMGK